MAVRDQPGARTDTSTSSADPARLEVVFDDAPARAPRHAWRVGLAVLLALLVVGAGWWRVAGDDKVRALPAAEAPAPAPVDVPAVLAVRVQGPATVVVGQSARFVVSYTDGKGIFSGGTEDWGDAGVGSVSLAACVASAPAAVALHASYVATHTWRKAASYPVSFAVTTYTCRNGRATEETRNVRRTVVVHPR